MKKLILLIGFVLGIVSSCSNNEKITILGKHIEGNGIEKEEVRNIDGYKSIGLVGNIDVILTDQSQGEIKIIAEENIIPLILINKEGNNLKVTTQNDISFSTKKKVQVYIPAQDVENLELMGSGDIGNEGDFSIEKLRISLIGSGDIVLKGLKTKKVDVFLRGSGDISLYGVSQQIDAELKGSGDISAFGLITESANVELQGSGDVEIFSKKSFGGIVRGSGDIKVKGNPRQVSQETKGSGKIRIL